MIQEQLALAIIENVEPEEMVEFFGYLLEEMNDCYTEGEIDTMSPGLDEMGVSFSDEFCRVKRPKPKDDDE